MFSKIIKKILHYLERFSSKHSAASTEIKKPIIANEKFLCSLSFELGFDSNINIRCFWPDLTSLDELTIKLIADQYAKMIYIIDNGLIKKDIIDTLYEVNSTTNPYDIFFVQEVLDKWVEYSDQINQKISKPIIKPSQVFKHYK